MTSSTMMDAFQEDLLNSYSVVGQIITEIMETRRYLHKADTSSEKTVFKEHLNRFNVSVQNIVKEMNLMNYLVVKEGIAVLNYQLEASRPTKSIECIEETSQFNMKIMAKLNEINVNTRVLRDENALIIRSLYSIQEKVDVDRAIIPRTKIRQPSAVDQGQIFPAEEYQFPIPSRNEALEKLNLRDAKKAGPFLDGCNVYLSGFKTDQVEKLCRVLNGGGATRFNEISESVTHVIIGETVPSDMKILKSSGYRPYILSVDWVLESMKRKCPAPEDLFLRSDVLLTPSEPPSPLSKKGLQMLLKPTDKPVPTFSLDEKNSDDSLKADVNEENENHSEDLVQHYISNGNQAAEPAPGPSGCGTINCTDRPLHGNVTVDPGSETTVTQESSQFTDSSVLPKFYDGVDPKDQNLEPIKKSPETSRPKKLNIKDKKQVKSTYKEKARNRFVKYDEQNRAPGPYYQREPWGFYPWRN